MLFLDIRGLLDTIEVHWIPIMPKMPQTHPIANLGLTQLTINVISYLSPYQNWLKNNEKLVLPDFTMHLVMYGRYTTLCILCTLLVPGELQSKHNNTAIGGRHMIESSYMNTT